MAALKEIIFVMNELAPERIAESWDNVGLLVGNEDTEIKKVLVALDATDKVIEEAINLKAELIITHHPIIFGKLNRITASEPLGKRLIELLKASVNVYSAHTNLDMAIGGTNDTLAESLGLRSVESLCQPVDEEGRFSLGRCGLIDGDYSLAEFCGTVKHRLKLSSVEFYGDAARKIRKAAVLGGSGGEIRYFQDALAKNCDVLLTGDIKYHNAQAALEMGLCLIDATHYATENLVCGKIKEYIENRFTDLNIYESKADGQITNFI